MRWSSSWCRCHQWTFHKNQILCLNCQLHPYLLKELKKYSTLRIPKDLSNTSSPNPIVTPKVRVTTIANQNLKYWLTTSLAQPFLPKEESTKHKSTELLPLFPKAGNNQFTSLLLQAQNTFFHSESLSFTYQVIHLAFKALFMSFKPKIRKPP